MKEFFYAKSVAVVGVSEEPSKVGHVIFRNLIDSAYSGHVYIVNKKGGTLLNKTVYASVKKIPHKIDLVVIAVPASEVAHVLEDCGSKGVHHVVIISAGFSESGNQKLEDDIKSIMKKHKIQCVGVNCLGVLNVENNLDTLFLPRYRMRRPRKGKISFISQSGAVGSATLDLIGFEGYGVAKFISYGNATNVDESDFLEYLGNDNETKVICMYIEGVRDGQKFLRIARKVAKKKPVIVLKGGTTKAGSLATMSHTGSLAGEAKVYEGVFKQAGLIQVSSLREMFNVAKVLDKGFTLKSNNVQVITDGGGFGILAVDAAEKLGLSIPDLSDSAKKELQKVLPVTAAIKNPLDVIGDADTARYKSAIEVCLKEKNTDVLVVVLLFQVPRLSTDAVDMIIEMQKKKKKPIIAVSPGGDFTQSLKRSMEASGIPVFDFPEEAMMAVKQLVNFSRR